jgi:hypothetical protein
MTTRAPRTLTLATLALIVCACPSPAEDRDSKDAAFSKALAGDWEGSLEYRDYSNDKRVTLPTTLASRPDDKGKAAVLKFRYDEGKGRFVEGESTLRVDSKKNTLVWESDGGTIKTEYALTGLDAFAEAGKRELVLDGHGTENGQMVEVRQTITRDGDELKILRETRKPGGSFAFRNAYTLKRKPAPSGAK